MEIRVDKCKIFGIEKGNTAAKQTFPKMFVNSEQIPAIKKNESSKYLERYFNFEMDNWAHKHKLLEVIENVLNKIDTLPLHPKFKLEIYQKYLLSKISWHLRIADIGKTWLKEMLDTLRHNRTRRWLEMPANGILDIVLLAISKFGLNIVDISTKQAQCQVSLRNRLSESLNEYIRHVYNSTKLNNLRYDRFTNCREVLKEFRDGKISKVISLASHSIILKTLWQETLSWDVKQWHHLLNKLPENIYNFCICYLNNTLPTVKNMVLRNKNQSGLCNACQNSQTLQHAVSACKVHL